MELNVKIMKKYEYIFKKAVDYFGYQYLVIAASIIVLGLCNMVFWVYFIIETW